MSVQSSKARNRILAAAIFGAGLAIAVAVQIGIPGDPGVPTATAQRTVEQDRQLLKDFGIARQALTEETAAELPDLYSPSLTSDPSYSWDNGDYTFRLNTDRIVPVNQIVKLGGEAWSLEKKQAFGSDIDNLSPTSHAANSWKGLKTPAGLAEDQKAGTFSWTDSCAEVYKDLAVLTPVGGCAGVPEDFDSCGYAERYREIAARYELKISKEDRDALDSLSVECPKN